MTGAAWEAERTQFTAGEALRHVRHIGDAARRRGRSPGRRLHCVGLDVCRDAGRCSQSAAADDERRAVPGRRCPALLLVPVAAPSAPGSRLAGSDSPRVARQRHPRHRASRRRHGRRGLGGAEDPGRDCRAAAGHHPRVDDHHHTSSQLAGTYAFASPLVAVILAGGCSAKRSACTPWWPPPPSPSASPSSCCTPENHEARMKQETAPRNRQQGRFPLPAGVRANPGQPTTRPAAKANQARSAAVTGPRRETPRRGSAPSNVWSSASRLRPPTLTRTTEPIMCGNTEVPSPGSLCSHGGQNAWRPGSRPEMNTTASCGCGSCSRPSQTPKPRSGSSLTWPCPGS